MRGLVVGIGVLLGGCSPELAQPGVPSPSDPHDSSSTGMLEPSPSSTGGEQTSTSSGEADSATEAGAGWVGSDLPGEPGDCYFGARCPGGDKCVPRTTNDDGPVWSVCAPVVRDPVALGGDCSAFPPVQDMPVDDCDADTYCVVTDTELQTGTCMQLCGIEEGLGGPPPDPSVCAATQVCQPFGTIIHVCSDTCHPLSPSCDAGLGCYPTGDAAVCMPSGAMPIGEACDAANACEAGATCLASDVVPACASPGCCVPLCDTSVVDECDAAVPGTACTAYWDDDAPAGLDNLGACAAP